ncbi:MAG: class I SAM-dependent methyltransferase [Ignavibacteriaceae bacterium]|nr:class I SAM-dependent methyltransferase [Ignavibacteriaceae bacterium]
MSIEQINYNKISETYLERYSQNKLPGITSALQNAEAKVNPCRIIEIGCGPGYWLTQFKNTEVKLFGIDYSKEMLSKSGNKQRKFFPINANAVSLPVKSVSFDLVYCVNAIHHFPGTELFIKECVRILRRDGLLIIIGLDPAGKEDEWYVYNYFDNTFKNDLRRFPSFKKIEMLMKENGFTDFQFSVAETVNKKVIGKEVLSDYFLQKESGSTLAALSESEYSDGITKIKNTIIENPDSEFLTLLHFKMISARLQ